MKKRIAFLLILSLVCQTFFAGRYSFVEAKPKPATKKITVTVGSKGYITIKGYKKSMKVKLVQSKKTKKIVKGGFSKTKKYLWFKGVKKGTCSLNVSIKKKNRKYIYMLKITVKNKKKSSKATATATPAASEVPSAAPASAVPATPVSAESATPAVTAPVQSAEPETAAAETTAVETGNSETAATETAPAA